MAPAREGVRWARRRRAQGACPGGGQRTSTSSAALSSSAARRASTWLWLSNMMRSRLALQMPLCRASAAMPSASFSRTLAIVRIVHAACARSKPVGVSGCARAARPGESLAARCWLGAALSRAVMLPREVETRQRTDHSPVTREDGLRRTSLAKPAAYRSLPSPRRSKLGSAGRQYQ